MKNNKFCFSKKTGFVVMFVVVLTIGSIVLTRALNKQTSTNTRAGGVANCLHVGVVLTTSSSPYKYNPKTFCVEDGSNENTGHVCANESGVMKGYSYVDLNKCPTSALSQAKKITPTPPPWGPIPCLSDYQGNAYTIAYGACFYDTSTSVTVKNSYYCQSCTITHGSKARYNCLIMNSPLCFVPTTPPSLTNFPTAAVKPLPTLEHMYNYLVQAVLKDKERNIDIYIWGKNDIGPATAYVLGSIDYFKEKKTDISTLNIRIVVSCADVNVGTKIGGRYVIRYAFTGGDCTIDEGYTIQAYP